MAVKLSMKATGLGGATRRLNQIAEAPEDMRPAFGKVAEAFYEMERKMFASRGRRKWPAADADTIRIRRRKGYPGRRPMIESRDLIRSLTSPVARGAIAEFRPREMAVGTSLPYARLHQNRPGHRFRRVIELRPVDRTRFIRIIRDWITEPR